MPKKTVRVAPLPAGLIPLLSQPQLETYYNVADWTVLQWIKQGMPVEPVSSGRPGIPGQRKFDLAKVQAWHAEQHAALATAG